MKMPFGMNKLVDQSKVLNQTLGQIYEGLEKIYADIQLIKDKLGIKDEGDKGDSDRGIGEDSEAGKA